MDHGRNHRSPLAYDARSRNDPNTLGELAVSAETLNNGRVARKSPASQLDRPDGILDGLAEALHGSSDY